MCSPHLVSTCPPSPLSSSSSPLSTWPTSLKKNWSKFHMYKANSSYVTFPWKNMQQVETGPWLAWLAWGGRPVCPGWGQSSGGSALAQRPTGLVPGAKTEKSKTFRIAVFIAQKLSGRGKGCVNQIFAIKMCGNHNFAPKGWFNSKIICLSIWIPATKLSESLF